MIDCEKLNMTGQTEAECTIVQGHHSREKTIDVLVECGCAVIRIDNWLTTVASHYRSENCSLIRFTSEELRKIADAVEAFEAKRQKVSDRCYFCQTSIPTTDEAIDAGWTTSFFVGESKYSSPVCPRCIHKKLVWCNHFDEYQLKKE